MSATFDKTWIWHPSFSESANDTAGLFLHFRREFTIGADEIPKSLKIHITADTKYRLYVNKRLVTFGPVKGDQNLWFFDEVDIGPYLVEGLNRIGVHVLRFFYSTQFAPSFPRLPTGGLRIIVPDTADPWSERLCSGPLWETAIDPYGRLRVDEPEDCFLHIYEVHSRVDAERPLQWVPAKILEFKNSTGNSPPWHLSPRLIPEYSMRKASFSEIHNVQSNVPSEVWSNLLLANHRGPKYGHEICLAPGSRHQFELEASEHTTAFIKATFSRSAFGGGYIKIAYSESYEDEPDLYKGVRRKAHRRNMTKQLLGPHDLYYFQVAAEFPGLAYYEEESEEVFAPFHFRTFRFIKVEILVGASELAFRGLEFEIAHYPLDVQASISASSNSTISGTDVNIVDQLWKTSLRTLINCMHDCYEDCPFYEQLQYAMDTRSSAIFTYCVSGDDTLARQAIIQLYNSFQPRLCLTASRAPTHRQQFIPHFSLYWICMLNDHFTYFGDKAFLSRFIAVADGVLSYFGSRIDPKLGLVRTDSGTGTGIWSFVDWTEEWKPYGFPAICESNGVFTFTNEIYAYTLKNAATLVRALGRRAQADEYEEQAMRVIEALRQHCFDGEFFTDSLVSTQKLYDPAPKYSQHSQVWAVLSGAVRGDEARKLLQKSMQRANTGEFVKESISMSFYTMRAMSVAGGSLYDEKFHGFWKPWVDQLELGLTTWVEDSISQRSDCHAWGSVPLYEFMAEVVGVRPAEPGWKIIEIKPRLQLYEHLAASVPLSVTNGASMGVVHVSWDRKNGDRAVNLHIRGDLHASQPIPIRVCLPGHDTRLMWAGHDLEFTVWL
jgi:hypothetical protein